MNQYDNLANRLAHYESTGEIWEQTDGKITHLVCTAGTGGTITGTAKFLKEKIRILKFGQLMYKEVY
jgi:cystathionine beta-synthase